jgi:hypothetical protein
LRDPERLYEDFASRHNVSSVVIDKPDIRDCDRSIISPSEYEAKLVDGAYVAIEVLFKV